MGSNVRKKESESARKARRPRLVKLLITQTLLAGFFGYVLWKGCEADRQRSLLKKQGVETKAVITHVRQYGTKGDIENKYFFVWNNSYQYGRCLEYGYQVGDSISIILLPDHPEINRTRRDVYGEDL